MTSISTSYLDFDWLLVAGRSVASREGLVRQVHWCESVNVLPRWGVARSALAEWRGSMNNQEK